MLGLVRDPVGLLVREGTFPLTLENLQHVPPSQTLHSLELFDEYERCQWLPTTLDDELGAARRRSPRKHKKARAASRG